MVDSVPQPKSWPVQDYGYILLALVLPPAGLILAVNWYLKQKRLQPAKPVKMVVAVLITAIIGTVLYIYAYTNLHNNESTNNKTGSSSLGQFSTYKLPGSTAGKGVSFLKPNNFSNTVSKSVNHVTLSLGGKPANTNDAYIDVTAYPVQGKYDPTFSLDSILSKPDSKPYLAFQVAFAAYLKQRLQTLLYPSGKVGGVDLKASKPIKFSNASLNSKNTWKYTFSASYFKIEGKTISKALNKAVNGQMLVAYSNGIYYYFIVMAETPTWQANYQVWPQILSSVKINQ